MSKWTPGKWDCVTEQRGGGWEQDYLHISIAAGETLIAAYEIKFAEYPNDDECIANARLIAEAPAMAEELAHLLALIEPALESGVTIPGLATMNRTRAILARLEADK